MKLSFVLVRKGVWSSWAADAVIDQRPVAKVNLGWAVR